MTGNTQPNAPAVSNGALPGSGKTTIEDSVVAKIAGIAAREASGSSIYRAMEELVGMEVTEVNVTINDVHIPSDDDDQDERQETRVQ